MIKDLLHNVLLAAAGRDKGNSDGVVDDREGKGDALRGRLGGVVDGRDPGAGLAEEGVAGEERAGMAVRAAAEEEEVEDGQADRVAGGEAGDEGLLVLVGELLEVIEVGDVDGVDFGLLVGGELVEQLGLEEGVVGVGVVEGHGALVGEEDFPAGEVDLVVGPGGGGKERLGERLGERAAGHGDLEGAVAGEAGVLSLNNVEAEGRCEGVDAGESVQVGLSLTHCGGGVAACEGGGDRWRSGERQRKMEERLAMELQESARCMKMRDRKSVV